MALIRALACLALVACTDTSVTVVPVIDVPIDDSDAVASPLDSIELTVAHQHSDIDIVSQTFAHGAQLVLPGAPFGDDLVIHMSGFVGASKVAYGRSCPFKIAATGKPVDPHIFFSRNVKFATMGIAPLPRITGHAVEIGSVAYLAGGTSDGASYVLPVEQLDLVTGDLTTNGSVTARDNAVEAVIGKSPGRALLIGGSSNNAGVAFLEVIDGHRIDMYDAPHMGRVALTATSLADGRVIAIGGNAPGEAPSGEIDILEEMMGGDVGVRPIQAMLAFPRSEHTVTRLGDDVGAPLLIVGGRGSNGQPVVFAELFKPLSESLAPPTSFSKPMIVPRHKHSAVLMPDGSVLIIGGLDALEQPIRKLELFSIDGGFTDAGDLPAGAGLVDFSTTTLPDGRVLIAGGRVTPDGPAVNTAYIARLNSLNGSLDVIATDHLAIARANHQALLLCDGTVLISGGTTGQFPAERYNPPSNDRR